MLSTALDSHVPGEEFCLSFHTRNHTRPDISLGPVFFSSLLSKIRFMSSFVKNIGTRAPKLRFDRFCLVFCL